jgi:DNA-binding transcriptional regulator LsrR (DeoR family)|tara:strand:- start:138 stop:377 length:240 start_codon:yes stop_codon:yes gene_type:complete
MKTHGVEITKEQQEAGMRAMFGKFRAHDVTAALEQAGVPHEPNYLSHRTADKLLQKARKDGLIRVDPENKRRWIRNIKN